MNEVEKMYENAEVEPEKKCYYWDCPYSTGIPANDIPYAERNCQDCNNPDKAVYPPFTAEKQLSLMAFLINRKVGLSFKAEQGEITVEAISRGLAGIVNRIWQDLTDAEKAEIKNILESEVRE